jgi:hypothetical protein
MTLNSANANDFIIAVLAGLPLLFLLLALPPKKVGFHAATVITTVAVMALFWLLAGCANAPPPAPTTSKAAPADPLADALGRIGSRTASQATGMGGNAASREVYTVTGGSLLGQIGGSAVRNTATEIQRWWSTR